MGQEHFSPMPIRLLNSNMGHYIEETTSTNDWIRKKDIDPGSWVVAEAQSAGKGRKGRHWRVLGVDHIVFSGKIRMSLSTLPFTLISLFAGSSLLKAIFHWIPERELDTKLKWPNDIYKNDLKIAGFLIETEFQSDEFMIIIGFGLNIYGKEIPKELEDSAGFLLDEPPANGIRKKILTSFMDNMNSAILALMDPSSLEREIEWIERHSVLLGKKIHCNDGGESIIGKAIGYDRNGFLILLDEQGRKRVLMDTDPSFQIVKE